MLLDMKSFIFTRVCDIENTLINEFNEYRELQDHSDKSYGQLLSFVKSHFTSGDEYNIFKELMNEYLDKLIETDCLIRQKIYSQGVKDGIQLSTNHELL